MVIFGRLPGGNVSIEVMVEDDSFGINSTAT